MADVLQQGWEKYLYCLQRYPLRTKAITAGVLGGSSDCLAQKLGGAKSLQYKRAIFMALYGLLYAGPFGHFFHKLMDRIFAGKKDGTTVVKKLTSVLINLVPKIILSWTDLTLSFELSSATRLQKLLLVFICIVSLDHFINITEKVVVEQLTSNPWNNLLYMCYIGLVLEGRTWTSLKSKLRTDYPGVQLNSWKFWPIVGLLNYRYMPQHLRVLFANLAAMCWANYLKWRVLSGGGMGTLLTMNSGSASALKKAL